MNQSNISLENDLDFGTLKETTILLNAIFDSVPDPICIKDTEDRIIKCNLAALSFWNRTNKEIIGRKCTEVKLCSKLCEESITKKACKAKRTVKTQKYIKEADMWVDVMAYPVLDKESNEVQLLVEYIKDISDLKRTETTLQKNIKKQDKLLKEANKYNTIKTEIFTNISHELKTPLNIILSTLQLLESYKLPYEKTSKYTKIMKQNCYRLIRLLNNLIDTTKIESGYFKLNLENQDIVNIIKQITLSIDQYIENKNINLLFDSKINEKVMACDIEKLERIMLNLLSNAAKFTPPGGEIKVSLFEKDKKVIISVKDTGIGIPPEKQKLIFKRFGQINSSITRQHEGSGIGLSLVKSLVELHGGIIYFCSEYQKGTEFIIELPIVVLEQIIDKPIKDDCIKLENREVINIEFSDIYM